MGLGKTVQSVALLNDIYHNLCIRGPFLIVAPLSSMCFGSCSWSLLCFLIIFSHSYSSLDSSFQCMDWFECDWFPRQQPSTQLDCGNRVSLQGYARKQHSQPIQVWRAHYDLWNGKCMQYLSWEDLILIPIFRHLPVHIFCVRSSGRMVSLMKLIDWRTRYVAATSWMDHLITTNNVISIAIQGAWDLKDILHWTQALVDWYSFAKQSWRVVQLVELYAAWNLQVRIHQCYSIWMNNSLWIIVMRSCSLPNLELFRQLHKWRSFKLFWNLSCCVVSRKMLKRQSPSRKRQLLKSSWLLPRKNGIVPSLKRTLASWRREPRVSGWLDKEQYWFKC